MGLRAWDRRMEAIVTSRTGASILVLTAAMAFAAAASAQTLGQTGDLTSSRAQAAVAGATFSPSAGMSRPPINLSGARASLAVSYAGAGPTRQAGVAQTAVGHRFGSDGPVGSVGYLCGIDRFADANTAGRGPTSGFGHQGTFLGASLGYTFK